MISTLRAHGTHFFICELSKRENGPINLGESAWFARTVGGNKTGGCRCNDSREDGAAFKAELHQPQDRSGYVQRMWIGNRTTVAFPAGSSKPG